MEQQTQVAMQRNTVAMPLERLTFSNEQVNLIRSQIAPNANPAELELFLYQCRRTGLDPMARQIYCIHRGGKMTIQTSIDGFRVIAERSGDYAGQDEPQWDENERGIIRCRVTVYRFAPNGQRYPAGVGVAYFSEYNAGGPMWQKMPHTMIAKCAEALALRKAYPQDLSGLYTMDEMKQADAEPQQTEWQPAQPVNVPEEDESVARAKKAVDEAISALNQCESMADIDALEESYTAPETMPKGQKTDWLKRVKRYKDAKADAIARIEQTAVNQ